MAAVEDFFLFQKAAHLHAEGGEGRKKEKRKKEEKRRRRRRKRIEEGCTAFIVLLPCTPGAAGGAAGPPDPGLRLVPRPAGQRDRLTASTGCA